MGEGRWPMPRCGKRLPKLGEPCARRKGHKDWCRSEYANDNRNAARRRYWAFLHVPEVRA